jgi:hypothetical protein
MKTVFLDTNILLDVILHREEFFPKQYACGPTVRKARFKA